MKTNKNSSKNYSNKSSDYKSSKGSRNNSKYNRDRNESSFSGGRNIKKKSENLPKAEKITPVPFRELGLESEVLTQLDKLGFSMPSEIQQKVIPLIIKREKDVVGVAQTGTGKTGAFAIPIINELSIKIKNGDVGCSNNSSNKRGQKLPKIIILAPTRELAIQVTNEIEKFSGFSKNISALTLYGGASITQQQKELRKGCDFVVGTPGRVVDMIKRKDLKLEECSTVVLDEADEMLKMGFVEDLEFILQTTPKSRKTYLFSATMPPKIKQLSQNYMQNREIVTVEKKDEVSNLISQEYFVVEKRNKMNTLIQFLMSVHNAHAIIFCRTRADVDTLTDFLNSNNYKANCIHGDVTQNKREKILQDFKNRRFSILVATDVAARGIHVDNISHVINYTLPDDVETYTHRIGRTGRAGNSGIALSFVSKQEMYKVRQIENELGVEMVKKEVMSREQAEEMKHRFIFEDISKTIASRAKSSQKSDVKVQEAATSIMDELLVDFSAEEIAQTLLEKEIGQSMTSSKKSNNDSLPDFSSKLKERKIFVAKGKVDKLNKKSLITMLEKDTGVKIGDVKNVDICDTFSFVTLNSQTAQKLVEVYRSKKGRNQKSLVEFSSN